MTDSKFYNKMGFEIKLKRTWIPGSPSCILKPGDMIEGPYDILSNMPFLQYMQLNFCEVDSQIQRLDNSYYDVPIQLDVKKENNTILNNSTSNQLKSIKLDNVSEQKIKIDTPIIKETDDTPSKPSTKSDSVEFNINEVNWVTVKIDLLERVCKEKSINIDHTNTMKPKDRKWELVRLVKKAYNI